MKILFVVPRYHLNLYYRVKALQNAGHEVFLLVMYKLNSERYDILEPIVLKHSKINVVLEKINRKYENDMHKIPNSSDLKKKIKEISPDILIVKNLQGGLSLLSFFHGRKIAKKIFALVQTNKHFVKNRFKKVIAFVFKKFFKVKVIITPLKNKLKKSDPWFSYIPFVIEINDFEKHYFKDNKINILDIGKFVKRKDHITLLKAINRLKDRYNIKLTIVGEKMNREVDKKFFDYIEENNLQGMVIVKENLPHKEVLNVYREQDLFVLPSYNEPSACSTVEAMAYKLPVIISDDSGTNCYIKEGENGYVFKNRDDKDLAEKIEKIIKDKGNLIRMGEKGFIIAKEEHSLGLFIKKFNKLI